MVSEQELSDAIVSWSDTKAEVQNLRTKMKPLSKTIKECEATFQQYLESHADESSIDLGGGQEFSLAEKKTCSLTQKVYREYLGDTEFGKLVDQNTKCTQVFQVKKRKRSVPEDEA